MTRSRMFTVGMGEPDRDADDEPLVVDPDQRQWEGWPADRRGARGEIAWKTLFSADLVASDSLSLGIARLRPGEALREHRHPQSEVYLVLAGEIRLTVAGRGRRVTAGEAAFVAGQALHAVVNEGGEEARFAYVFAVDSADEVTYEFPHE